MLRIRCLGVRGYFLLRNSRILFRNSRILLSNSRFLFMNSRFSFRNSRIPTRIPYPILEFLKTFKKLLKKLFNFNQTLSKALV